MKWITHERGRVDHTACPRRIARSARARQAFFLASSDITGATGSARLVRVLRQALSTLPLVALTVCSNARGLDEHVLARLGRIDLPNVHGRIDHLAVDPADGRMFVAALGNDTVEVVDLRRRQVTATLRGFSEPQGVLTLPDRHEVWVTNGESPYVDVYDSRSLNRLFRMESRIENDNIRYDPGRQVVYVGCGTGDSGGLCVFDVATHAKVREIALGGHPESLQLEQAGTRIFVNVPGRRSVEVVDRRQGRVVGSWPVASGWNFPMALDEQHGRLFVGTRSPSQILVIDTKSGKTVTSLKGVGDVDDLYFDGATGTIYASGGAGAMYVFRQRSANEYVLVDRVPTASGARTSLYVPQAQELFVAAPKDGSTPARILLYEPHAQ
ncbi:MAG: hypothetical protein GC151_18425 [Betaproteobacteria bacterium]|nr:hypothetical protein [Betaproteobacteria bacterium]